MGRGGINKRAINSFIVFAPEGRVERLAAGGIDNIYYGRDGRMLQRCNTSIVFGSQTMRRRRGGISLLSICRSHRANHRALQLNRTRPARECVRPLLLSRAVLLFKVQKTNGLPTASRVRASFHVQLLTRKSGVGSNASIVLETIPGKRVNHAVTRG